MIEYLEQLVKDKEYTRALEYAEQLLLNPDNSARDLMEIYSLLLMARSEVGEYYGAQVAGELAVKMATELEAWDHHGESSLWLGYTYLVSRQYENALAVWYDYLAHLQHYKEALKAHVSIVYNIGVVEGLIGRHDESIRTLKKAADLAQESKDDRKAHGIRHALIDAHMTYGQLDEIPPLLAKCAHYLRCNPDAPYSARSKVWHHVLRVRFALVTNRLDRAFKVAKRGLQLSKAWPELTFNLYMLRAQAFEKLGNTYAAMQEAVLARGASMEARRFDLEYMAASYVYGLLSSHSDLSVPLADTGFDSWDPSARDLGRLD